MAVQRIAVIGERSRTEGFALAGALTRDADSPESVRSAWASLPDEVAVVVLTPAAAKALREQLDDPARLPVVMPP